MIKAILIINIAKVDGAPIIRNAMIALNIIFISMLNMYQASN